MFSHELKMRGATMWDLPDEMLDYALADHLLDLHEASGDASGHGHTGTLVAAVEKAKPRAHLKVAWRVLDAWRMRAPPRQAPTVPHELAYAEVTYLVMAHEFACACVVLLLFCALLRVSEALSLTWADLQFLPQEVLLVLGETKRGREQKVVLRHPRVIAWLVSLCARFEAQPGDRVCDVSYARLSLRFQPAAQALGFGAISWTSHGLRRGGATQLLRERVALSDVMLAGRWASERSCREYLRRGAVALVRLRTDITAEAWSRVEPLATVGDQFWAEVQTPKVRRKR